MAATWLTGSSSGAVLVRSQFRMSPDRRGDTLSQISWWYVFTHPTSVADIT